MKVVCPGCDLRGTLVRVEFHDDVMRALCRCGCAFAVDITPEEMLELTCTVLEQNPFVTVGPVHVAPDLCQGG